MLEQLTAQLGQGRQLTEADVQNAVGQLVDEKVAPATKADFLTALARKGETPEEIAAFARALRAMAVAVPLDDVVRADELLDVCGTGGDHLNTFNISTTVALVCAAAGVAVAKHGNRAVTSRSGSADVLEALGLRTELEPAEAAAWLRDHHFAFFFAPRYHPAFKHIAPARKLCAQRGQRTIFNFLGPLLNPARPTAQLIGVPQPTLCKPLARVLQSLGIRRGMVVSGEVPPAAQEPDPTARTAYLDECSTLGPTHLAEFYQERGFNHSSFGPAPFPVQPASLEDLKGGDCTANAEIIRNILRGQDKGPRRDAVLINAAAALFVAGKAATLQHGWELAADTIDSGRAWQKLETLVAASQQ